MNRSDLNRMRVKILKLPITKRLRLAGWLAWLAIRGPKSMLAFEATLSPPPVLVHRRQWLEIRVDCNNPIVIGREG